MTDEKRGEVKWLTAFKPNDAQMKCSAVRPKYSRVSESLRFVTPSALQCALFCGGKQCKYDNPSKWDGKEMAINGLYSSWDDYGVRSLPAIADMVKVMDFAVSEGKVAVHCHAGLGRTGVLIACYLIYSKRIDANQAIQVVRQSRPRSVQTRGQIRCVRDFEKFIAPCWLIYQVDRPQAAFSLDLFLRRQRHVIHGEESKVLKYVPKIVLRICHRLLILAGSPYNFHELILEQCRNRSFREFNHSAQQQNDVSKSDGGYSETDDTRSLSDNLIYKKANIIDRSLPEGIDKWQSLTGDTPNKPPTLLLHEHNLRLPRSSSDSLLSQPDLRKAAVTRDRISFQEVHISSYDLEVRAAPSLGRNNVLKPLNADASAKLQASIFSLDTPLGNTAAPLNASVDCHSDVRRDSVDSLDSDNDSTVNDNVDLNVTVTKALAMRCGDIRVATRIDKYKRLLNQADGAWDKIGSEDNPFILTGLLFSWLDQLQEPVLRREDLIHFGNVEDDLSSFQRSLTKEKYLTISCLLTLLSKIGSLKDDMHDRILRRIATALTADRSQQIHENERSTGTGFGVVLLPFLEQWLDEFHK